MSLHDALNEAGGDDDDDIVVDLSGAGNFSKIPAGDYHATVVECKPAMSKSGNPIVKFKFSIKYGDMAGRNLFMSPNTNGPGAGNFVELAKALGYDTKGMTKFSCSSAIGKEVKLVVSYDDGSSWSDVTPYPLEGAI